MDGGAPVDIAGAVDDDVGNLPSMVEHLSDDVIIEVPADASDVVVRIPTRQPSSDSENDWRPASVHYTHEGQRCHVMPAAHTRIKRTAKVGTQTEPPQKKKRNSGPSEDTKRRRVARNLRRGLQRAKGKYTLKDGLVTLHPHTAALQHATGSFAEQNPTLELAQEELFEVFSNLTLAEKMRCRLVCRSWYVLLSDNILLKPHVEALLFSRLPDLHAYAKVSPLVPTGMVIPGTDTRQLELRQYYWLGVLKETYGGGTRLKTEGESAGAASTDEATQYSGLDVPHAGRPQLTGSTLSHLRWRNHYARTRVRSQSFAFEKIFTDADVLLKNKLRAGDVLHPTKIRNMILIDNYGPRNWPDLDGLGRTVAPLLVRVRAVRRVSPDSSGAEAPYDSLLVDFLLVRDGGGNRQPNSFKRDQLYAGGVSPSRARWNRIANAVKALVEGHPLSDYAIIDEADFRGATSELRINGDAANDLNYWDDVQLQYDWGRPRASFRWYTSEDETSDERGKFASRSLAWFDEALTKVESRVLEHQRSVGLCERDACVPLPFTALLDEARREGLPFYAPLHDALLLNDTSLFMGCAAWPLVLDELVESRHVLFNGVRVEIGTGAFVGAAALSETPHLVARDAEKLDVRVERVSMTNEAWIKTLKRACDESFVASANAQRIVFAPTTKHVPFLV